MNSKTFATVRAAGAIARLPGESFAAFSARQRAAQLAAVPPKKTRTRKKIFVETAETRLDNLGESPDY